MFKPFSPHSLESAAVLLERVAQGDGVAFRSFYALFSERVYNTALRYVRNVEDAEEITQDVFVKIHKNAASFKGEAAVRTWVYRIVVNTALNYQRKRRWKWLPLGQTLAPKIAASEQPSQLLETKERQSWLLKTIEQLPSDQRIVVILFYLEELPQKEIAVALDRSLKAVESLLQRAKRNLKKYLDHQKDVH